MSQTRVYWNGVPQWRDDGPAVARRVGFGGSTMGHFSGTQLTVGPTSEARSEGQRKRNQVKRDARAAAAQMRRGSGVFAAKETA